MLTLTSRITRFGV